VWALCLRYSSFPLVCRVVVAPTAPPQPPQRRRRRYATNDIYYYYVAGKFRRHHWQSYTHTRSRVVCISHSVSGWSVFRVVDADPLASPRPATQATIRIVFFFMCHCLNSNRFVLASWASFPSHTPEADLAWKYRVICCAQISPKFFYFYIYRLVPR